VNHALRVSVKHLKYTDVLLDFLVFGKVVGSPV